MKAKYAIIILVLGWCFNIVGAFMKITHWPGANELLAFGVILEVIGAILLLYKLVTYSKIRDFLNR